MEKKPIKVGLWGIGRAGHNMHCSELDQFSDLFTIVAACDIDPSRVKVLEDNWNEVRELLQNALDDAVLMGCTQAQFKHEYTRLINALQSEYKEKSSL